MNNTFILWCIPFFLVSGFHLFMCFVGNKKLMDISKAVLMPMLLFGLWGFTTLTKNETVLNQNTVLLSLGIIFGGMGDVYLLKQKEMPSFLRGIAAFFLGHVFYIIVILSVFSFLPLPTLFIVIACIVYVALILLSWLGNKRPKGPMGLAVVVYAAMLAAFNAIAVFLLCGYVFAHGSSMVPFALISIFLGSLLFLISDSILAHTIFVKTFPLHKFFVMLTYLAAQFFIVFGISSV